jgi:hypothetical protein
MMRFRKHGLKEWAKGADWWSDKEYFHISVILGEVSGLWKVTSSATKKRTEIPERTIAHTVISGNNGMASGPLKGAVSRDGVSTETTVV